jgi:hypothetical protein
VSLSVTATVDQTLRLRDPFDGRGGFGSGSKRENGLIVIDMKKGQAIAARIPAGPVR